MVAKDVSRETSGIALPAEVSQDIWANVQAASVVMNVARKVELPGTGVSYQQILTDSVPEFVGETQRKPVSNPTFEKKTMRAHKLAVVQTYSDEFRRDLPGLYKALLERLPGTLAKAFDDAVLHGVGAPASDFDTFENVAEVDLANATPGSQDAYAGFLEALGTVPSLTGWALSPQGEIVALANRDTSGAPILVASPTEDGSVGRVLGRPVFQSANAYNAESKTVGFGGNWEQAYWGQVENISIDVSDNPVYDNEGNLITAGWQDNMISVRAEVHVGFIADLNAFVRLADSGN